MNAAARWLIGGAAVHRLAETFYDLAMPLAILGLTGSPFWMAVMFAAGFLAELVVAVAGGSVVDRLDRRRVLLTVTAGEAVVLGLCGLLAAADLLGPLLLVAAAATVDLLVRLYLVADTAALPRLVARPTLPRANGIMQAWLSAAQAVGPFLAGAAIALADLEGVLLITAATFLVLFALLTRIPWRAAAEPVASEGPPARVLAHLWEGVRFTFADPLYRQLAVWRGVGDFAIGASFLMFVYYMQGELRLDGVEIGLGSSLGAIGGIVGGLLFARIQARIPSHALVTAACVGMAAGLLALTAAGRWWTVGAMIGLVTFCLALLGRLVVLLFQDRVPGHLLGRVTATSQILTTAFGPLSVLSAAWVADAAGARLVFLLSACVLLALAVASRFGAMGGADWRMPDAAVEREHR